MPGCRALQEVSVSSAIILSMDLFDVLANLANLLLVVISFVLAGSIGWWLWGSGGRNPGLAIGGALATLFVTLVLVRPVIVDKIKGPTPPVTQYPTTSNPYGQ